MREYARKRGYWVFYARACGFMCAILAFNAMPLVWRSGSWYDYAMICSNLFNVALFALCARDYDLELRRIRSDIVRDLAASHRQRTVALRQELLAGESAVADLDARADPRHLCVPVLRKTVHG